MPRTCVLEGGFSTGSDKETSGTTRVVMPAAGCPAKASQLASRGPYHLPHIPHWKVETERIRSVYSDLHSLADAGDTLESLAETQKVLAARLKSERREIGPATGVDLDLACGPHRDQRIPIEFQFVSPDVSLRNLLDRKAFHRSMNRAFCIEDRSSCLTQPHC